MFRRENRAIETPKTEIVPPHIIMVQSRIKGLAHQFDQELSYPTPHDRKIMADLTDHPITTATGGLLTIQRNLVGGRRMEDLDLLRLAQDLEYLSLYEKHGLDGLNDYLSSLITDLSTSKSYEENVPIANNLNDFLRRAIYLFPHVARGVKVGIRRDFKESSRSVPDFCRRDREDFTN